jgi:hypothetical protein
MKKNLYIMLMVTLLISITLPAAAQAPPGGNDNAKRGQGFQGSRGMNPPDPAQRQDMMAQMQGMMANNLKEQLSISDDEWTVIGPKVMKVVTLSMQSQSRGNPMGMMMGRGNRPGGPRGQGGPDMQGQRPPRNRMQGMFGQSDSDTSMEELQKLLENKNADPNLIKQAVTKVRQAKEKNQREFAAAKKELRELLTVRQEAIMISMGMLD